MDLQKTWHLAIQNQISLTNSKMKRALYLLLEDNCQLELTDNTLAVIGNSTNTLSVMTEFGSEIISEVLSTFENKSLQVEFMLKDQRGNIIRCSDILSEKICFREPSYNYSNINSSKTFNNFIVAPRNQKLIELVKNIVAGSNENNINPLNIYGETGLGKTHLLWAIANSIKDTNTKNNAFYMRADRLLRQYAESLVNKASDNTVNILNNVAPGDIFLIDDIDSISKTEKERELFFEIIAELINRTGVKVIYTSTKKANSSKNLTESQKILLNRGRCLQIFPPDNSTKEKIIASKCKEFDIELSESDVNYISKEVSSDVRGIEALIKQLKLIIEENKEISLADIKSLLNKQYK